MAATQNKCPAFFIADDKVMFLANPGGAAMTYHAQLQWLAAGAQSEIRCLEAADTLIVAQEGDLDLMINGLVTTLPAGQFANIVAGTWHAWRNAGSRPCSFLVRTVASRPMARACQIRMTIAAA